VEDAKASLAMAPNSSAPARAIRSDLGVIGNCAFSALISRAGEIAWCCLPCFDSAPLFSSLTDPEQGGRFQVGAAGNEIGIARYLPDTNVLDRLHAIIEATWHGLATNQWLLRPGRGNDLPTASGCPIVPTFGLVEALAASGRSAEAHSVFERARAAVSPLGLMSAAYAATGTRTTGAFPHTATLAAFVRAAFVASPRWEELA
jgi:GH15 family glucan-1,4-alpha-glucosidase